MCGIIGVWLKNFYEYVISDMENDEFFLWWLILSIEFWRWYKWIGGGGISRGDDISIETLTIQETYFQSSDLEFDYDENDGGENIFDFWEDLEVIGQKHIDIGTLNSIHESYSLFLKIFLLKHF